MARAWRGLRQFLAWVARAWRGHGAGVARACLWPQGGLCSKQLCIIPMKGVVVPVSLAVRPRGDGGGAGDLLGEREPGEGGTVGVAGSPWAHAPGRGATVPPDLQRAGQSPFARTRRNSTTTYKERHEHSPPTPCARNEIPQAGSGGGGAEPERALRANVRTPTAPGRSTRPGPDHVPIHAVAFALMDSANLDPGGPLRPRRDTEPSPRGQRSIVLFRRKFLDVHQGCAFRRMAQGRAGGNKGGRTADWTPLITSRSNGLHAFNNTSDQGC
eukprot:gene22260-biopygen8737